jgi:hypothetical protein
MSNYEGIDTIVLYDQMAYEDYMPLSWQALAVEPGLATLATLTDRNLKALQVCAVTEPHSAADAVDEKLPFAAELHRLDSKLNLVMDVLGQLMAASVAMPPSTVTRFNALGARWQAVGDMPAVGTRGLLKIHLQECLAQPLTFLAHITSVSDDGLVRAQFTPPGEATADLIEKLAFRRHRRQVAGVRQQRRS